MWCGHSNKSLSWYVDFELLNENQKCFFFWPFYPWVGGFWDFHLNSESNEWTSFSHTHQSNEFGKFLFWHWWKLIECWFCIFVLFFFWSIDWFTYHHRIHNWKKIQKKVKKIWFENFQKKKFFFTPLVQIYGHNIVYTIMHYHGHSHWSNPNVYCIDYIWNKLYAIFVHRPIILQQHILVYYIVGKCLQTLLLLLFWLKNFFYFKKTKTNKITQITDYWQS